MQLSIVTTMYCSAPYIGEFYRRSTDAAKKITEDYEIIFVNDGSPDNVLEITEKIYEQDKRVKIIDLSRNFGHHKAMMCGLSYAQGKKVFLIDCDLEEAPEWLISFYDQMTADNCDVVYGVQQKRKGKWFERFSGALAYRAFNAMCDLNTEPNRTSAMLMTRKYVQALSLFAEREPVFLGISVSAGFTQKPIKVEKISKGTTTYTITKRIATAVNMITAFSSTPLHAIFYSGLAIFSCSVIYACYLFINRIFFFKPLDGWTSIMMSIWLLGGLIISFIGIIGIYLSRVFIETKQRPNTIIKEIYNHSVK